jgi:hypothetical protein
MRDILNLLGSWEKAVLGDAGIAISAKNIKDRTKKYLRIKHE